ncbi:MAG: GNAT family N-acetyltransferase [Fibrobacterota bacterium]
MKQQEIQSREDSATPRYATEADREFVIDTLCRCFCHDPYILWLIAPAPDKKQALYHLCSFVFEETLHTGKISVSPHNAGVALWSCGIEEPLSLLLIRRYVTILRTVRISCFFRMLLQDIQTKKKLPKNNCIHLCMIGVLPEYRGQGYAGMLIDSFLKEHSSAPVFLETSVEKNISIYRKKGFEIYDTLHCTDGLTLSFMKRPVR